MRKKRSAWRYVLFGVISVLLLVAALAFASTDRPVPASPSVKVRAATAPAAVPPVAAEAVARVRRMSVGLEPSARRFLAAFFRYEVGKLGPGVKSSLLRSATTRFADELLEAPPRVPSPGALPPAASVGALEVTFISPTANRVVIGGQAIRGGSAEQFSFVFVRTAMGWLASGPGQ